MDNLDRRMREREREKLAVLLQSDRSGQLGEAYERAKNTLVPDVDTALLHGSCSHPVSWSEISFITYYLPYLRLGKRTVVIFCLMSGAATDMAITVDRTQCQQPVCCSWIKNPPVSQK